MAKRSLKALTKELFAGPLAERGFVAESPRFVARTDAFTQQGVELLPPRSGRFQVNLWWRFRLGPPRLFGPGYAGAQRLDRLIDPNDGTGYAASGEVMERSFARFTRDLLGPGMALLEHFRSPESALAAVEGGILGPELAFGGDGGWMRYRRGLCLLHVGRTAEGLADLTELVEDWSEHFLLEHARKMRAEGKEAFAREAEARYEAERARGERWWGDDRKDAAIEVIAAAR